jgi:F0F1-type ATP synthase beta subunit
MKNLIKITRKIKQRIKNGNATNEEALNLLGKSLNEFQKHNSKNLELIALQQEYQKLKNLKTELKVISTNTDIQEKRKALLFS